MIDLVTEKMMGKVMGILIRKRKDLDSVKTKGSPKGLNLVKH